MGYGQGKTLKFQIKTREILEFMVIVIDSVIITFVCVCGLILEHQWNCNFDISNLYEWLQYRV